MVSVKLTNTLRSDIVRALLEQGGFYKVGETKKKAYVEAYHAFYFKVLPPQKTTSYTISDPIPDLNKSFGLVK